MKDLLESLQKRLEEAQKTTKLASIHEAQTVLTDMSKIQVDKRMFKLEENMKKIDGLDLGEWQKKMMQRDERCLLEFEKQVQELTSEIASKATLIKGVVTTEEAKVNKIVEDVKRKKEEELEEGKRELNRKKREAVDGHKQQMILKLERVQLTWASLVAKSSVSDSKWERAPTVCSYIYPFKFLVFTLEF